MESVSFFYIWPDVTIVHLICVLPLAWLLAQALRPNGQGRSRTAAIGVAALVAWLVPWTYAGARARHERAALAELLELSRIGEARTLAHRLLALDSESTFNGRPLLRVVEDLDRAASELETRAAAPLNAQATADERLERAREMAMLGRTDAARDVLTIIEGPRAAALQATILENQGEWDAALRAYSNARAMWQSESASADRSTGLLQAIKGIAYTQRKSGRYPEAEATYQELIGLAPTAESHFLLAQFYEDTQQAEQARAHARRAMALAPDVYRQPGEKLINKLSLYHFGCLGVYRAESQNGTRRHSADSFRLSSSTN